MMEVIGGVWSLFFSLPWMDDLACYLHSLPLHPVFSSVHFILTAYALRKEPGSVEFAMEHPVASCVMTYIVASSGGILANLMTGAPPLECVANGWSVAVAVICWYLMFLGPLEVCFHLCSSLPVQLTLFTVEEVGRAKKILSGVSAASALYPGSLVAMAVVGMLKGSGKKWGITWYRLVYQPQSASTMELKKPSFITKVAMVLALLLSLNTQRQFCPQSQLLLAASLLLVFLRYHSILVKERDFLEPLLGSVWGLATVLAIEPAPTSHSDSISDWSHRDDGDSSCHRTDASKEETCKLRKR